MSNTTIIPHRNVECQETYAISEDPPPSYSEAITSAYSSRVPVRKSSEPIIQNPVSNTYVPVVETPPLIMSAPPSHEINTDYSYDNIGFSNIPESITNQPNTSTNDLNAKRYAESGVDTQARSNANNYHDDCCNDPDRCFLGCLCCMDFCRCLMICLECALIAKC